MDTKIAKNTLEKGRGGVMTNDELNEAIALAKGWTKKHGRMDKASLREHDYWINADGRKWMCPDEWSTDIAAAMKLADEFPEWSAGRYPSGYKFHGFDYINGEIHNASEQFGITFEIAICLAYLAWKAAQS